MPSSANSFSGEEHRCFADKPSKDEGALVDRLSWDEKASAGDRTSHNKRLFADDSF